MTPLCRLAVSCALLSLVACGTTAETPPAGQADATSVKAPALALAPEMLLFGPLAPGASEEKTFTLSNEGQSQLRIFSLNFVGYPVFELRFERIDGTVIQLAAATGGAKAVFAMPVEVSPGGSLTMTVTFAPDDAMPRSATLFFETNDSSPFLPSLAVNGNHNLPCFELKPANKLDFGAVQVDTKSTREVIIDNCGAADLVITTIEFSEDTDPEFWTLDFSKTAGGPTGVQGKAPSKAAPLVVPLGGKATFSVQYAPDKAGAVDPQTGQHKAESGSLQVLSDTFNAKGSLDLSAVSVSDKCPVAKVVVKEGETVIPQTPLHLDGSGSKGADGGAVSKWLWTVKQPAGGTSVMSPDSSSPKPLFVPMMAGKYTFCLDVWDVADEKSCLPACSEVMALPTEDIYIELFWDTPADPDQTDSGPKAGANLDLHFAHPLANGPDIDCDGKPDPWFSNPFDTFWFNPNPNWGSASPAVSDDPKLMLEDNDGAGPESIALHDPEGKAGKPTSYGVGVHYWNDHGFGISHATVNVYIAGVLAVQIAKATMNPLDMWYVGKVFWPNHMSGGSLEPFQICYRTADGDPCKGTGKYWLTEGEYCIKSCYLNPAFIPSKNAAPEEACKK